MSFLLYAVTAAGLLWLCHRSVLPISRTAMALLFLFPLFFAGRALLTDSVYAPIDLPYATEPLLRMREPYGLSGMHNSVLSDISCQMIPWRKAVQRSLQNRVWPIYNPFILSGDILAAAAQPAAYSPVTLLACLLPIGKGLTFSAAIAFFIAGLCAFLFAREIGSGELSGLVAAAVWMYSTGVSFMIHWPLAVSWTFLPFILLGVRRVIRAPGSRSVAALTTGFLLLLLAGHPETALHVVTIGCFYALFELLHNRRHVVRSVVAGTGAGALSLLISAIYILPIIDAAPQTLEHQYREFTYSKQTRGVSTADQLARLATDFFPFLHVGKWRSPEVTDVVVPSAAVGSIALAMTIYAIWRRRSPETWFFLGIAVFGLLARAEWPPLARAMQKLPLFDITVNDRFSFAASFALAILAAMGAETWMQRGREVGLAATSAIVLLLLTIGTLWIQASQLVAPNTERWGDFKVFAELGLLALATLVALPRIPKHVASSVILGLLLLQRTMSESGAIPTLPAGASYPPIPVFAALKSVPGPFRVTGIGLTFVPGMSGLYELEDVRGYEAMTLARYVGTFRLWSTAQPVWFNRVDDLSKPFLNFLNVKFAVVWERYPLPEGWREFAKQPGTRLVENTRVIDRAFVPRYVRLGMSDSDALNQMDGETDFRERAWIRASPEPHERVNGPGRVITNRRTSRGYDMDVDMERDGWVVVSESSWKGWRGYIDGHRVQLQIANTSFLAIFVPQGRHHVRLVYLPDSFVKGRTITFATLLALALWTAPPWRRFRKK